jgi:hypothetical protein
MIQNLTDFTPNRKNLKVFTFGNHGIRFSKNYLVWFSPDNVIIQDFSYFESILWRPFIPPAEDGWVFWTQLDKITSEWLSMPMRLISIYREIESSNNYFLLFDEVENGISSELMIVMTNSLVKARQQVVVTTHSPVLLNYLDDASAKQSVIYLYRNKQGYVKSIPFFSIPSLKKKLECMGPGEVFVDTSLTSLITEIEGLTDSAGIALM